MENTINVLTLVCSLKASPAKSSSELMAKQVLAEFESMGAASSLVRIADRDIKPGVETDMGGGDEWPAIRQKLLAADILLIATPIWVGHPSSLCQRVIERLDAELSEQNEQGLPSMYGKCAAIAVVGNEDGAHKVCADAFQALNDTGFSLAAGAAVYWNGEAMHTTDYKDLKQTPDKVTTTLQSLARNTIHLARLLKANQYPSK